MAKSTRVVLVCDFHDDGTEAVETVRFRAGRANYDLDVCQEHLDELVEAARRVSGGAASRATAAKRGGRARGRANRRPGSRSSKRTDNSAVREWARSNGYTISDRGRISSEILTAYKSA